VVALTVQALLAARSHLPAARVLLLSLVACLVGLVGAKLYYLTGHWLRGRRPSLLTAGMCIQGFVLGAIAALVVGARAADVPVGALLDVTAPGLLVGMTIGRFGCFFGGCCAGRPTASRWGLWSSDRRLGMRRIPTQLLESAVALLVGLAALLAVWATTPLPAGVVFVGAIAAYTFGRQLLFPFRAGPRHTAYGRTLTMALAGLVAAAAIVVAAFAASSG
jgi:phosphatidylglycerol:prolipoprotein diacylglycerol transferase